MPSTKHSQTTKNSTQTTTIALPHSFFEQNYMNMVSKVKIGGFTNFENKSCHNLNNDQDKYLSS